MRRTVKKTETAQAAAAKKTAPKTTAAKEAAVKETAVKETAAKEAAAKETAVTETAAKEAAAKETAAKEAAVKETVYLQYLGKEINKDDLTSKVKEIWKVELNRQLSDMTSLTLYLKPEENRVYYVINEEITGSLEL